VLAPPGRARQLLIFLAAALTSTMASIDGTSVIVAFPAMS